MPAATSGRPSNLQCQLDTETAGQGAGPAGPGLQGLACQPDSECHRVRPGPGPPPAPNQPGFGSTGPIWHLGRHNPSTFPIKNFKLRRTITPTQGCWSNLTGPKSSELDVCQALWLNSDVIRGSTGSVWRSARRRAPAPAKEFQRKEMHSFDVRDPTLIWSRDSTHQAGQVRNKERNTEEHREPQTDGEQQAGKRCLTSQDPQPG